MARKSSSASNDGTVLTSGYLFDTLSISLSLSLLLLAFPSQTAAQDGFCSSDLLETCANQGCCSNNNNNGNAFNLSNPETGTATATPTVAPLSSSSSSSLSSTSYNCSLPGLKDVFTPGQYEGTQINYMSFATETSSPNFPVRAKEFEECTGGTIVFSEAADVWQDPIRDLGTQTARGSELYDGYFMSYSYFPEVSALGLAEHLNDRIRKDAARLQWEDVMPAVKTMGEYRKDGKTNIDFLMYDGDFFVPVIRLDLLEEHDLPIPNTWEEVVNYAKYFNGTDLNEDGEPDYGFCHFPQLGGGYWDERWAEALYSTWASVDQTKGIQQGFFFDEDTMEPKLGAGFREAASIWKDLWTHGGEGCISPNFITGRCAIGFSPPGCWKGVFLDPDGVARKDANGTVIWQPTMKSGEYAEPYRFRPFGSLQVTDPTTGELTKCTPKLCPKAERVPLSGHHGEDDRASVVLPPSPYAGELINRVPFYWSGGLGTLIRKSAPEVKKDMMWDFFVYTNSPDTSVYDVANYASWLDSWRRSQLNSRDNFLQAGWSQASYEEHVNVMNYALSNEGNGGFNLRLPSSSKYTRDVVGARMGKFIEGSISLDAMVEEITNEWNDITDQAGRLEQLEIYRSSLGLDLHSEVEICRLHRELMDERDPSICSKYDIEAANNVILGIVLPIVILSVLAMVAIGSYVYIRHQNRLADSLWKVKASELDYGSSQQVLGYGSFGVVLLAEYRGTKVAVKKVIPKREKLKSKKGSSKSSKASKEQSINKDTDVDTEMGASFNPGLRSVGPNFSINSQNISQSRSQKPYVSFSRSRDNSKSYSRSRSGSYSLSQFGLMEDRRRHKKMTDAFIVEMRTLAKLRHPNITTTMGAVLERGLEPMLVMEYMENGSLYEAMRNETLNLKSQEDILIIAQDIAHGLRFLHSADVIHGDLKSKNVLIDSNLRAKVSDFGLSAKSENRARGTPYWMAPELLIGTSANSVMSDIYAFGILLFEVYSGEEPYKGEVFEDVINNVCDPSIRKRPPVPPLCPPTVSSLMHDCWRHDPLDRPATKDVDAILQSEGTIQGRIVRIEALNKDLVEENRQISAEQAVQLGHFACMSHEIRTPLNCIIGVSSLLEDDETLGDSYKESVKMIVSSSRLLKQVVDDVLDFSKFVSGNAEIDIQRTDLQETLTNIMRSMGMSPITERKEIVLRTLFDPRVPQYVDTDERRLQQILYNLLSNAVKFSKDKNNVDLVVSLEESANMSRRLQLQVKDYGKGIQKGDFEKVFQPFAQTEAGMKSVDGGTGLGLAITKQLTELLGGSIIVDSEFGEWTTFSVQLPLSGSLVDVKPIAKKLHNCCICLVGTIEFEVKTMVKICVHFRVKYRLFADMKQLEDHLSSPQKNSPLACVVQEDLFDSSIYDRIIQRAQSILISFGPSGKLQQSQMHYQSLSQKFPAVMMQEIGSLLKHGSLSRKSVQQKSASASGQKFDELKILVAEDNKVSQKILVRMLDRLGVKKANLAVTDDGKEAVEAELKRTFDIALLDIQMPIMDGLEACKKIVSRERTTPCPKVVFLSANLASDYKSISIENGATDYLSKPIGLADLKKMLEKLVSV